MTTEGLAATSVETPESHRRLSPPAVFEASAAEDLRRQHAAHLAKKERNASSERAALEAQLRAKASETKELRNKLKASVAENQEVSNHGTAIALLSAMIERSEASASRRPSRNVASAMVEAQPENIATDDDGTKHGIVETDVWPRSSLVRSVPPLDESPVGRSDDEGRVRDVVDVVCGGTPSFGRFSATGRPGAGDDSFDSPHFGDVGRSTGDGQGPVPAPAALESSANGKHGVSDLANWFASGGATVTGQTVAAASSSHRGYTENLSPIGIDLGLAQSPPARVGSPSQRTVDSFGARSPERGAPTPQSFLDIRQLAERLRQENSELREMYERHLANREEPSVSTMTSPSGTSYSGSDRGRRGRRQSANSSDLPLTGSPEFSARVAELARDLRKAVSRAVEKRKEVEERHLQAEDNHAQRMAELQGELDSAEMEVSSAEAQLTTAQREAEQDDLEQSLRRGQQQLMVDSPAESPTDKPSNASARLIADLRAERGEREAAHRRTVQLREELRGVDAVVSELRSSQSARQQQQRTQAQLAVPLRDLSTEVSRLRDELRRFQSGEVQSASETYATELLDSQAEFEARLAHESSELSIRRAALKEGQQQLEGARAEVRQFSFEAVQSELLARERQVESEAERSRLHILEAEEMAVLARNRPLSREAEALTARYEEQKRQLFAYAAALSRGMPQRSDEVSERGMVSRDARGDVGGVEALIRVLAQQCGSPEVAFLMLDVHGIGRLTMNDFCTGLLLGCRFNYPAVSGLYPPGRALRAIFTALDTHKVGSITCADLAACCPHQWKAHGGPPPLPEEKLRALPLAAGGNAEQVFQAAIQQGTVQGAAEDDGLPWPAFEEIVCTRMMALSENEAYSLFKKLAGKGPSARIVRHAWMEATHSFESKGLQPPQVVSTACRNSADCQRSRVQSVPMASSPSRKGRGGQGVVARY